MCIRVVACIVAVGLIATGCGGGGDGSSGASHTALPKPTGIAKRFTISLKNGVPVGGPATIKVTQDQRVTITVTTSSKARVHLHGYDILVTATPKRPAVLDFMADTAGVFDIEEEDSSELIANVAVYPE